MSSSLKSIKYEYEHCLSSTNGSISIDIDIFLGVRLKKAPEAVCKWGPISKKLDLPFFWPKTKIYHPGKLKFQNDPKMVCPINGMFDEESVRFTLSRDHYKCFL